MPHPRVISTIRIQETKYNSADDRMSLNLPATTKALKHFYGSFILQQFLSGCRVGKELLLKTTFVTLTTFINLRKAVIKEALWRMKRMFESRGCQGPSGQSETEE